MMTKINGFSVRIFACPSKDAINVVIMVACVPLNAVCTNIGKHDDDNSDVTSGVS